MAETQRTSYILGCSSSHGLEISYDPLPLSTEAAEMFELAKSTVKLEERKGYRDLFDATKRFIQNGEAFEIELSKLPPNATRDVLLASAQATIAKLLKEAE